MVGSPLNLFINYTSSSQLASGLKTESEIINLSCKCRHVCHLRNRVFRLMDTHSCPCERIRQWRIRLLLLLLQSISCQREINQFRKKKKKKRGERITARERKRCNRNSSSSSSSKWIEWQMISGEANLLAAAIMDGKGNGSSLSTRLVRSGHHHMHVKTAAL